MRYQLTTPSLMQHCPSYGEKGKSSEIWFVTKLCIRTLVTLLTEEFFRQSGLIFGSINTELSSMSNFRLLLESAWKSDDRLSMAVAIPCDVLSGHA